MPRVVEIVRQIAPRALPNYVQAFDAGDKTFEEFGITTPLRIAHLLAQMLHECMLGQITFENMNYRAPRIMQIFGVGKHSAAVRPEEAEALAGHPEALAERVYGLGNRFKAKELGNTAKGDGFRFRGGGLLQTTGGANYKRMGDLVGADFHTDPTLIVDARFALKPALFEWRQGNLNAAADRNDINTITKVINGGFNGLEDRRKLFQQIFGLIHAGAQVPNPGGIAVADEDTKWLQQALNDLGADPRLAVDGDYGPGTRKAVREFQAINKLLADGIAGDVTKAMIRLRLAATRGKPNKPVA